MPDCTSYIRSVLLNSSYESITQLEADTPAPLIVNSTSNQLFRLEIIKQETVLFNLALTSNQNPSNIGVTVNFYQYINNTTIVSLGSVLITEMNLSFQKDFNIGFYIICIRSNVYAYTGFLTGYFSRFPTWAQLSCKGYTGTTLNSFEILLMKHITLHCQAFDGSYLFVDRLLEQCNKLLYYIITDGKLPENLNMDMIGRIEGILPNLDCDEQNANLSPSQNWYHDFENYWMPWGREYRFKIYLWMVEYPEINTDRWFCIKIFNNWSWDRDNFKKQPLEYVTDNLITPLLPDLPELCCEPEKEVLTFNDDRNLKALNTSICPCDIESDIEKTTNLNFLKWYQSVLLNPPGDENPYIQQFIDKFRETKYFKELVEKYSIEEEIYTESEKDLKEIQNRIQSYNNQLDKYGRRPQDIDAIMLSIKNKLNVNLPTTGEFYTGELIEKFNLETYPND